MTAAPRHPLHVVVDHDEDLTDTTPEGAGLQEWRGQSIAARWEHENQLLGALMWMPAAAARVIVEGVPDTAIWRPLNRWAYEIIRRVIDAGRVPDPVTVLAYARHHPGTQALQPKQATTPGQHHRLALHLADLYTHTVTPAAATSYARHVLDDTYRRVFAQQGIRMQQLGECGNAELAELAEQFAAISEELANLWRKAEAAAQPGWGAP